MPEQSDLDELVSFALGLLPSTRQPSGLYCFDRAFGSSALRGESVRYSLMVLIGLERAAAAGYPLDVDLGELLDLCLKRVSRFTPGDVGLALWAASRANRRDPAPLVEEIERRVPDDRSLAPLVGMEIAWLIIGLAHTVDQVPGAAGALGRLTHHLHDRRRAPSGLYYHDARSKLRRHFPNFATEIYTVLALASCGRLSNDDDATGEARVLADQLLRLQRPDGAWPWLFHADRAVVVEPYELYSVHQDAMAPMALLELTELTGDQSYAAAALRGLAWSTGDNELGSALLDRRAPFAHRSIRRRSPWSRAALAGNVAGALVTGRALRSVSSAPELNATCRPYHLGWTIEAWAGRVVADNLRRPSVSAGGRR